MAGDNAVHIKLDDGVPRFYDQHGAEQSMQAPQFTRLVLDNATIKTLPGTSQICVPGIPGRLILVHRTLWRLHSTVAYTNTAGTTDMGLWYGAPALDLATELGPNSFFNHNAERMLVLTGRVSAIDLAIGSVAGQPVSILTQNNNGASYTGGDPGNYLEVYTWYSVL